MAYLVGVRLNENIERGALGGPRFNTSVLELDSGFEKRNINWSVPRAEFDLGFGLLQKFQEDPASAKLDVDELINFFYIVQGKGHSFRMKDWSDFEIGYENGIEIARSFLGLGTGSKTDFNLIKQYTFGGNTFNRALTKLVDNAKVQVYLDTILQTNPAQYTLDADRGLVKFVSAPGNLALVEIRCEFDLHGRLDIDDLKINLEVFSAGSWPNFPFIELRGNGID